MLDTLIHSLSTFIHQCIDRPIFQMRDALLLTAPSLRPQRSHSALVRASARLHYAPLQSAPTTRPFCPRPRVRPRWMMGRVLYRYPSWFVCASPGGGSTFDVFTIDATGNVKLRGRVDPNRSSYTLNIVAEDDGKCFQCGDKVGKYRHISTIKFITAII